MRTAVLLLRDNGSAKIPAFFHGCEAAGYKVANHLALDKLGEGDLLLTWNRHLGLDHHCRLAEKRRAKVIVAENGYIGADANGKQFYAMALNHHNGAGTWKLGKGDRWESLKVPMREWRQDGRHVLLLPQRGIGEPGVRMPPKWADEVTRLVRANTGRPVVVRRHPGRLHIPLEPDLANAWCAVTWASGAGIKAIAAGIPVFFDFPQWIGGLAARPLRYAKTGKIIDLEQPFVGDRLPMFSRLAWAQWSLAEIESGHAITWLTS